MIEFVFPLLKEQEILDFILSAVTLVLHDSMQSDSVLRVLNVVLNANS